jgi:hypothetical protein
MASMQLKSASMASTQLKSASMASTQLKSASMASTQLKSVSMASTQLKSALEVTTGHKDRLAEEIATAQAGLTERNMAPRNLNLALEGFTRQRDNELTAVEEQVETRVARGQEQEEQVETRVARGQEQEELARQVKVQLDKAQQGLEAVGRLSSQVYSGLYLQYVLYCTVQCTAQWRLDYKIIRGLKTFTIRFI